MIDGLSLGACRVKYSLHFDSQNVPAMPRLRALFCQQFSNCCQGFATHEIRRATFFFPDLNPLNLRFQIESSRLIPLISGSPRVPGSFPSLPFGPPFLILGLVGLGACQALYHSGGKIDIRNFFFAICRSFLIFQKAKS